MQQPYVPWQQPPTTSSSGSGMAAFQYGLIFGGIIGFIDILYSYYLDVANIPLLNSFVQSIASLPLVLFDTVYGIVVGLPLYILIFVFFLIAGILAARKSKRVASGTIAGLLVAGSYLLVDLVLVNILMTYLVLFPRMAHDGFGPSLASAENLTLMSGLIYSFLSGLVLLGVGTLIGFLGGLIGKGGNVPAQPYAPYPSDAPTYVSPHPYPYAQPGQPGPVAPPPPVAEQ